MRDDKFFKILIWINYIAISILFCWIQIDNNNFSTKNFSGVIIILLLFMTYISVTILFWIYIYFFAFITSLFYKNKLLLLKTRAVYSYIIVITAFSTAIFSDFKLNDVLQAGIPAIYFIIGQVFIKKLLFDHEKNLNKVMALLTINIVTFMIGIAFQEIFLKM